MNRVNVPASFVNQVDIVAGKGCFICIVAKYSCVIVLEGNAAMLLYSC